MKLVVGDWYRLNEDMKVYNSCTILPFSTPIQLVKAVDDTQGLGLFHHPSFPEIWNQYKGQALTHEHIQWVSLNRVEHIGPSIPDSLSEDLTDFSEEVPNRLAQVLIQLQREIGK